MARRIIDLSYTIEQTMMVYPGLSRPVLEWLAVHEQDGHYASKVTLPIHVGTHIDAPKHFIAGGQSVDGIPLARLVGEAVLVDLSDRDLNRITEANLQEFEDRIKPGLILILDSGTHKKYGTKGFITDYPYVTPEAAGWLVERGIASLGVDMMAIDPLGSVDSPAHHIVLGAGIPIVENLAYLDRLDRQDFLFIGLPLKIGGAEGAPCRAIAVIEEG
ncbi:MAG: cyclase family protein [Deltaproteobacteria bacterium]|nr:cyclase family protein [Deltaproteobacteria bacterium]